MKVFELIEWLKTQPQDAEVEVLQHLPGSEYYMQGGECNNSSFNGEEFVDFEYSDLRSNPYIKEGDERFGKHYLLLGAHL